MIDDPTSPPVILPYILIDPKDNERYFISPPELTGDDIMHRKVTLTDFLFIISNLQTFFLFQTTTADTLALDDLNKKNVRTVMWTTRVVISCFVGVTLLCAILLVIFYRMRKSAEREAMAEQHLRKVHKLTY